MHFKNLGRAELVASLAGIALAISVFLPWYSTDPSNHNSNIDGMTGTVTCWQVHNILRILMLMAAAAPLILTWIILRDHHLSWPRGEMTAVVGIAVLGLLFYNGIVDRPGDPSSTISLEWGWFIALLASIAMIVGGAMRQSEGMGPRKPPGVM